MVVPKLPTGNLAPSTKQPTTVVKNVSQNVAKVFGSDDSEDVCLIIILNFFFKLIIIKIE